MEHWGLGFGGLLTHGAADGAHPEDALRPPIAHHASTAHAAHPHAAAAAGEAADAPRLLDSTGLCSAVSSLLVRASPAVQGPRPKSGAI
jgi:hypothetical protein